MLWKGGLHVVVVTRIAHYLAIIVEDLDCAIDSVLSEEVELGSKGAKQGMTVKDKNQA